jgi:hypothetical protein
VVISDHSILGTSRVLTNAGDDTLIVHEDIQDRSFVDMANGDDTLEVSAVGNGGTGGIIDNAIVNMGDGDDTIRVEGDISDFASIKMSAGNDTLEVGGTIKDNAQIDMASGDDTLSITQDTQTSAGAVIDMGEGAGDTLELHGDFDLDFSNANIAKIENLEKIDLSDGDHKIDISLDAVLNITDDNNTLEISGDALDTLNIDKTGWTQTASHSNGDGTSSYEYSHDGSSDSITLTVEDDIITHGM